MASFLIALAFVPALTAVAWMYTSPLTRFDEHLATKAIIRILSGATLLGGLFFQINFLAHHVSLLSARRDYILTLLVIDAIPIFFILFSRDPSRRRSNLANRADADGKKDIGVTDDRVKMQSDAAYSRSEIILGNEATTYPPVDTEKIDIQDGEKDVLRFVVFPRRNRQTFIFGVTLVACGILGIILLQWVLTHANHAGQGFVHNRVEFIRVYQAIDVLVIFYLLTIIFGQKRILSISPATLRLQSVLLGLPLRMSSFGNGEIRNIRFERWAMQSRGKTVERSGIRFEAGSKTYSFGSSMTERQAHKLIEQMRQLYPFPIS